MALLGMLRVCGIEPAQTAEGWLFVHKCHVSGLC
jgi:hypothetical protein